MRLIHKTIHIIFFVCLTLCGFSQTKITFLHTGDTHSQIEPFSSTALTNVGGSSRRYTFINNERKQTEHLFLFDTGDFLVGTPFFNLFKGEVEIQLMNKMGYDVVLLGNHEFDNGCDALFSLLKQAEFPIICSNYSFQNKKLKKLIQPYVTFKVNGYTIGVFGLSPDLTYLTSADDVKKNVIYKDPVATAKEMVSILKEKEKCQFIICLSHLGYMGKGASVICDSVIAQQVQGIDIIFGGHTHTELHSPSIINGIPICHSGEKGAYIEKMTITLPKFE